MAKKKNDETKPGRPKISELSDREQFEYYLSGTNGRLAQIATAAERLGKLAKYGSEYSDEEIDALETWVFNNFEKAFRKLRERPPASTAGRDSFSLSDITG